eukprot:NODE_1389_length_889_cov_272.119048_g1146_i0.p1 GENE.NODE_1389_length_889_cov_272.119048_g1146_i0~~NODE_1389_length_889_cov_272.119048_g1146_i0.p1  ORF type:complete len:201 (-),score=28.41 NODE_1389_length_889_cov_272.119048_g1146_i0:246-848(-)
MANQLLFHAIVQGDVDQAQMLLVEAAADVNSSNQVGETPCHIAAMRGVPAMLELLLSHGANPNISTKKEFGSVTPLIVATKEGKYRVAETLLNNHADPNIADAQGFTPLHYAARQGNLELSKLLIVNGANVSAPDNLGKPPYYWAKEGNHTEVMALLPASKYVWNQELKKFKDSIVWKDRIDPEANKPKKKKPAPKGNKS